MAGKLGGGGPAEFLCDGKLIATCEPDGRIIARSEADGTVQKTFKGHKGNVEELTASLDGWLLVSRGSDRTIRFWSLFESIPVGIDYRPDHAVVRMAVSPNKSVLAMVHADSTVKLFSIARKKPQATVRNASLYGTVTAMAVSSDSKSLACAVVVGKMATRSRVDTIRIWSLPEGQLQRTLSCPGVLPNSMTFLPDAQSLAAGCADGQVRIWSLEQGKLQQALPGHRGPVLALAASRDGTLLASGGQDGAIGLWAMPEGRFVKSLTEASHSACGRPWDFDRRSA
jgi:WD40 repeat protein